jgi:hypothetical protein
MSINVRFVVAIRNFTVQNLDKVQALWGILNSDRYGIGRKVSAIADILGINAQDIPVVSGRHLGICAGGTHREIARHLAIAIRKDWRRFTDEAGWVATRRAQLREREQLDWLRLPFAERIALQRASRAANGKFFTVPAAERAGWLWAQLQDHLEQLRIVAS